VVGDGEDEVGVDDDDVGVVCSFVISSEGELLPSVFTTSTDLPLADTIVVSLVRRAGSFCSYC
jgi:hypothetical protein